MTLLSSPARKRSKCASFLWYVLSVGLLHLCSMWKKIWELLRWSLVKMKSKLSGRSRRKVICQGLDIRWLICNLYWWTLLRFRRNRSESSQGNQFKYVLGMCYITGIQFLRICWLWQSCLRDRSLLKNRSYDFEDHDKYTFEILKISSDWTGKVQGWIWFDFSHQSKVWHW